MTKYRYGITAFEVSDINPTTGLATGTPKDLKEDIFRDSFDLIEEDGVTTDIFSEMDDNPKISFNEKGVTNLTVQIMDTSVDTLALLLGGTVVSSGTPVVRTWNEPAAAQNIEKNIKITTVDGYIVTVYRGKISAKKNFQLRRNNIWLIDVSIKPLTPLVPGLPSLDIVEPSA